MKPQMPSVTKKFTPEEVREWRHKTSLDGMTTAQAITRFLKDHDVLEVRNKPMIWDEIRPYFGAGWRAEIREAVDAHQSALNAVRDRLARYHTPSGHTGCVICEIVNDGIREGLWTAPEGWEEW